MGELDFNFNKFWGNDGLRERVVFIRGSHMKCIYCGEEAKTREHCPSKVFLQSPLPTDLPVLPACNDCNNGYSKDERFTFRVIELLYRYYEELGEKNIEINNGDTKDIIEVKEYVNDFIKQRNRIFNDRMGETFIKLAIGHAAYEISKGYYSQDWDGIPLYVTYVIKPLLSKEQWEGLEYAELIHNEPLPEIGSRVYRNVYVVQVPLMDINGKSNKLLEACFMDWTDVQDGNYKYIAFMHGDQIIVKIIIKEFLYAEIVFEQDA